MIRASELSWIAPFYGAEPRVFGKLVTVLRREAADTVLMASCSQGLVLTD